MQTTNCLIHNYKIFVYVKIMLINIIIHNLEHKVMEHLSVWSSFFIIPNVKVHANDVKDMLCSVT